MTHSYVCHDLFTMRIDFWWCLSRRYQKFMFFWGLIFGDENWFHVCHDSFICVPWPVHLCAMTHSYVCMTHSYVCMTYSYVCHDSFMMRIDFWCCFGPADARNSWRVCRKNQFRRDFRTDGVNWWKLILMTIRWELIRSDLNWELIRSVNWWELSLSLITLIRIGSKWSKRTDSNWSKRIDENWSKRTDENWWCELMRIHWRIDRDIYIYCQRCFGQADIRNSCRCLFSW